MCVLVVPWSYHHAKPDFARLVRPDDRRRSTFGVVVQVLAVDVSSSINGSEATGQASHRRRAHRTPDRRLSLLRAG